MSKIAVIRCLLSIVLAGYLVWALIWANDMAARTACAGIDIEVSQTPGMRQFVTREGVARMLHQWQLDRTDMPLNSIDTQQIEEKLQGIDNIEKACVVRTPTRKVKITVTPMQPVARIFENNGHSYYINRQGKEITANAMFHIDVPVITGAFDSIRTPLSVLPVIDHIAADPEWDALVSHVAVEPRTRDILLVPMIRGHVINIGDQLDLTDKLNRVKLIYRKVMPHKGWNYYDTISVKWRGQVVATRRTKQIPEPLIRFDQADDEIYDEDVNSMLTDSTSQSPSTPAQNHGQTKKGKQS